MSTLFDTDDSPREPSASLSLSQRVTGETTARPLHLSTVPDEIDLSDFYLGMSILKVEAKPQQLVIASQLAAVRPDGVTPVHAEVGVCVPRRAAKTTSIWAELLGRCAQRPGYQVCTSAQTGVKARERFMTVQRIMARNNVGDYVIKKGAGAEAIEWNNGSRLWVVPPEGGAFRGDAADVVFIDEGQQHGVEASADIMGGALALMDTRPGGQIIVAGTAGNARAGMLWDYLERGRLGQIGIVEYAVPDAVAIALEGVDELGRPVSRLNEAAILAAHPGIGTLTTLDIIRARFDGMGLAQFAREYGGQWPFDLNTRAIDPADWQRGVVSAYPPKPLRYALGFDVAPDQSSASLVAAWRDAAGRPWVEVIRHEAGDAWLPKAIHTITARFPNLRVGFDNIGPNQAVSDRLVREARPRPKLVSLGTREITSAAAQISQDIRSTEAPLSHVVDPALDAAADIATRRPIGDGSWAWGRRRATNAGGDISALVAGTNALKVFDQETRPSGGTGIKMFGRS